MSGETGPLDPERLALAMYGDKVLPGMSAPHLRERWLTKARRIAAAYYRLGWRCDWVPDDLNSGPDCPYCAGDMCARLDGLRCTHDRIERHGYPALPTPDAK